MKIKNTIILITTLVALTIFSVGYMRAFYYFPSDEISLPDEQVAQIINPESQVALAKNADEKFSMKLTIPSIKVNAKMGELGINAKGNMAAPRTFADVGWYKYGTFPGKLGSAVIAGHVDNGVAMPAVFAHLNKLQVGDDIYINTNKDTKLHFVVTGSKVYPYDSAPAEVFNDKSGKLIRLITCTGNFIKELRTHAERLVVTAQLVE